MLSHITGKLIDLSGNAATVDVYGVGYLVHISSATQSRVAAHKTGEVSLWTHLAVRENALDLYGFSEKEERALFQLLINVPGIGPKSALAILSLATVETLKTSILSGDITYLTKVSGVGKKSAEKIVLELKGKIGGALGGDDMPPLAQDDADVLDALQSLGYKLHESREVIKKLNPETEDVSGRVKEALKLLQAKN